MRKTERNSIVEHGESIRKKRISQLVLLIVALCAVLLYGDTLNQFTTHAFQCHTTTTSGYHYGLIQSTKSFRRNSKTLLYKKQKNAQELGPKHWLPLTDTYEKDEAEVKRQELEEKCISYISDQILLRLSSTSTSSSSFSDIEKSSPNTAAKVLAKGRFLYLCTNSKNEHILESLIYHDSKETDVNILRGSILALQSLLIFGMQLGFKGTPTFQQKLLSHLKSSTTRESSLFSKSVELKLKENNEKKSSLIQPLSDWDEIIEDIKALKHERNLEPAIQILSRLKRKQNAQGAFDLLVSLGVWNKHENLALLRSGFPTRFTVDEEEAASLEVSSDIRSRRDPDLILGLRKDLRRFKIYTIDNASASEIDDGISVEILPGSDGAIRQRYWIHIADADHWVPRSSKVYECARRRATSIYLPTGAYSMIPSELSIGCMSLNSHMDSYALSLGCELNEDGSLNESSIIVAPSLIRIQYRLTYEDVDEMLEEGVGYSEEWQLGALFQAASKRRNYRINNGSSEGRIKNPIPQGSVTVYTPPTSASSNDTDSTEPEITLHVETPNNAGVNLTSAATTTTRSETMANAPLVSPANLLVTEMMIMSGEAMGKWGIEKNKQQQQFRRDCLTKWNSRKRKRDTAESGFPKFLPNKLVLPYRTQSDPEFKTREKEATYLKQLQFYNIGDGYCAAWFSRRFFSPVKILSDAKKHSGMGLESYVQWSSPIRRFGDLQVHSAVKRFLRREKINQLVWLHSQSNTTVTEKWIPPNGLNQKDDLGCSLSVLSSGEEENEDVDDDIIDYEEGLGLLRAVKPLQRNSQEYWMLQYIQRKYFKSELECLVLGVVNKDRNQYAIYVYELGLETRYLSEIGELENGQKLILKVESVNPRMGFLTLRLAPLSSSQSFNSSPSTRTRGVDDATMKPQ